MPAGNPQPKTTQQEQRQFTRAPVQLNAEIHLDCGLHIEAHTRDLSLGGALLSTERYLPRGHPVRIILDLEFAGEACRIRAQGHVARVDDEGVAIAFSRIHPESLTPLCHIILTHAAESERVEQEMTQHGIVPPQDLRAALPK